MPARAWTKAIAAACIPSKRQRYEFLERLHRARPTHLRGIEEHFVSRLSDDELGAVSEALLKLIPLDDRPAQDAC